jgi:hypothetical protein
MEEEEKDDQPIIRPSPYMSPMYNYGSSIILLTNPKDQLHKMELTFRSMMEIKNGEPKKVGTPLMNEEGINAVIGMVQAEVSQVTIMGNLDENKISGLIDFLADTLARDLMMNKYKYNITDSSARDKIYFTALTTAFICMNRALNEGDRRFWKGSVQEIHSSIQQQGKSGGILSALNPWRAK